jgi:hypothetical protein
MTARYGGQLAMFLALAVIGLILATVAKGQAVDPLDRRPEPVPTRVECCR